MRPSRVGLAMLVSLLVVPGGAMRAAADVLCLRKSGAVIVRAACKGREALLAPGEVGLVAPSGPAGAPGTAGPEGLLPFEVLDARGMPVGLVASTDGLVLLKHPALVRPVLFDLRPEGFDDGGQGTVHHELDGCTGAAGLRPATTGISGLVPIAVLMGPVAFYETGSLGPFTFSSYERLCEAGELANTPRGTCCHSLTGTLPDVFPAARVDLGTLGFEPPFRMVLR